MTRTQLAAPVLTVAVSSVRVEPPTRSERHTMNNKSDMVGVAICWTVIILSALYLLAQVIRVAI